MEVQRPTLQSWHHQESSLCSPDYQRTRFPHPAHMVMPSAIRITGFGKRWRRKRRSYSSFRMRSGLNRCLSWIDRAKALMSPPAQNPLLPAPYSNKKRQRCETSTSNSAFWIARIISMFRLLSIRGRLSTMPIMWGFRWNKTVGWGCVCIANNISLCEIFYQVNSIIVINDKKCKAYLPMLFKI